MSSYSVKLKVNLKLGSGQVLTKGHEFRGPLKDLPKSVAEMVEEKSRHLEVRELAPVQEVISKTDSEDEVPESVDAKPEEKKAPKKNAPRKTVSRRTKKD